MEFEWDEVKNLGNVHKHLINFDEAKSIFDRSVLTALDTRTGYGEDRSISIGKLDVEAGSVVIVVAHTKRGNRTRIISARRANRKERKKYDEFVQG